MRNIIRINDNWKFHQPIQQGQCPEAYQTVHLPHTWNALDGQDGGNDYFRGKCRYEKVITVPSLQDSKQLYLEIKGANASADVIWNGEKLAHHDGGYSTFRVHLKNAKTGNNELCIDVDNSPNDNVYPQKADFTFYGGLYRDVNLIIVPAAHFDLNYHGSPGIKITPKIVARHAEVKLEAWLSGAKDGDTVTFLIHNVGSASAVIESGYALSEILIPDVHLWNGIEDPYLYQMTATYNDDCVTLPFGCRQMEVDGERGFMLNGYSYPLRGVSRHQDWKGVGNAITQQMMEEDLSIIQEMGANTIRLAHYQHDQYFYDLCDQAGIVLWVEIPYITCHMPGGTDNTLSQMTELIVQSHHHPSIFCWGLSNEITAHGGPSPAVFQNHQLLNDLCHKLDGSRPTVMAHVFMLSIDEPLVTLPDVLSYNLYYGWYLGDLEDNERFFDRFRAMYPHIAVGLSEYGADATLCYQTVAPEKGDYTEQYQAAYHEHMLKLLSQRPYIWVSHVWNMFDFGADGRNEGGENGVNHKGLVSFDRKTKKDAFYLYKAYLSTTPFVHLCSRRYVDRHEDITTVKVYSNQSSVSLFMDGKLLGTQKGEKVFTFTTPISGEHIIMVQSGSLTDTIRIRKVAQPQKEYILEDNAVINWFEKEGMEAPKGYFSIKDKLGDILKTPEGAVLIGGFMAKMAATRGDVAVGVKHSPEMIEMMNRRTVEETLRSAGNAISENVVIALNKALTQIKKPE